EELLALVRVEQRNLRHRLDARRDDGVRVPGRDPVVRVDDRLQARAAEPIDREGRYMGRNTGLEGRDPGDVDGVRRLGDVAEDDLVQAGGIEIRAREQLRDHDPPEL